MKRYHGSLLFFTILFFLGYGALYAQWGGHGDGHHCDPDSLVPVTVSGTAIVDSSTMHPMYYLDEDGDGQADYFLNFGPWWYEPDSSAATRPNDGDFITIGGGMTDDSLMGDLPVIIVYEINGEFWRDPFDPYWTHHEGHGGGHGHTWGWMHDSLQVVSVTGTAMVDSTFIFLHYYLDENNDGIPDYYLNFGPPWYEPPSGAERPDDGDVIDISGGLIDNANFPMIFVYEINGLVWRDTTGWGPNLGGRWIHRYMNQTTHVRTPFDDGDWMDVQPGWHPGGGGGHHGHLPNDLFCQMIQVFPQNIPNTDNENVFAAYEFGLFRPDGFNLLWDDHMNGGHIQFANNVQYQLHYNDIQLQGFNIDENTIQLKYWNEQSNSWELLNANVDVVNNTVTVSNGTVSSKLILTGQQNPLSINDPSSNLVAQFTLKQNYPNPFNPATTIEFSLLENAKVILTIYNVLGQKVVQLLDEEKPAGVYQVNFDASNLPSGIYFYELKVGDMSLVKKMNLSK